MTNNPIDSLNPIQVALGGLGTSTIPSKGVMFGNGTASIGTTGSGTATQVLTSNGPGMNPSFQAPPAGGGGMRLIQKQTATSSTNLLFSSGISNSYTHYAFVFNNVVPVTNGAYLMMKASYDGGTNFYSNAGNIYNFTYNSSTPTSIVGANEISGPISSSSSLGFNGTVWIAKNTTPSSGQRGCLYQSQSIYQNSSLGLSQTNLHGEYLITTSPSGSQPNAFNIVMSAGNILSGTVSFYSFDL